MDGLDFGWGFGLLLIGMVSLYVIPKGLLTFLIYYLPSNLIYSRFLKSENLSKNFFSAFFCWAILILISKPFHPLFSRSIETYVLGDLSHFIYDTHSGLHLMNLFFYQFVFWKYELDVANKKISIVQELSFKKKFFNYFLLFLSCYIVGFLQNPVLILFN